MKYRFFQNSNENIVRISALKVFIPFLGLLGSFLRLPGKPTGSLKKIPGSPQAAIKTFRAEILTIFSLLFWKIILSLTDLYLLLSNSQVTSLISKQFNSRHYSVAIFFGEQNFCSNSLEIQTLSTIYIFLSVKSQSRPPHVY